MWAVITVVTGYQIGYAAIGIGLIVGFGIRFLGRGSEITFGLIGAVMALLGCVLGNILAIYGVMSNELGVSFSEAMNMLSISEAITSLIDFMEVIDFVFYGLAIYAGFKFAYYR